MKKSVRAIRPVAAKGETGVKQGVQSVDRALRILEILGEDAEGYRLADLAVRTGLSPSTTHRLLTTMEQRRFVMFDTAGSRWHVGRRLFAVGCTFARQRNFVAAAMGPLRQLRDVTRETANLGIAEAGEIVVLAQVESREVVRAVSAVGGRSPMTSDALGKAMLAYYPEGAIADVIRNRGMRRATSTTITRPGALMKELATVRANGWAEDRGELLPELHCVASAVHDAAGDAVAAISVSGLASRMPDARIVKLGPVVRESAAAITQSIGGVRPAS